MSDFPRIAVGTLQSGADSTAILWGLMDAFQRAGVRVQSFASHAYFSPRDGARTITGLAQRHLDSWLMDAPQCRAAFARGTRSSDLAIVEGRFEHCPSQSTGESSLDRLCQWLNLPQLGILDVRLLGQCQLPQRPAGLEALLLDQVADDAELCRWQTTLESLWGVPVLGALERSTCLRRTMDALPPGGRPSLELCHAVGHQFRRHAKLDRIFRLARRKSLPSEEPNAAVACRVHDHVRVAVAYDEAFYCYFPDTLDLLEQRGATVCDFSPLADERLPPDTDVVYIGCGHPERFAAQLAENECLALAIRSHLCSGRRIYAECGGLAFLCDEIEMPDGQLLPMTGVLPATMHWRDTATPPVPTQLNLSRDTWIAPAGALLRGYTNSRWSLKSGSLLDGCVCGSGHVDDIVRRRQALGSRMHLNLAAHENLLERFVTSEQESCVQASTH